MSGTVGLNKILNMTRKNICAGLICAAVAMSFSLAAYAGNDGRRAEGYKYVRLADSDALNSDEIFTEDMLTMILMPQNYPAMSSYPVLDEAAAEVERLEADGSLRLVGVVICGCTSPDGLWGDNEKLGAARVKSASEWFKAASGLPDSKIRKVNVAEDWEHLCELVADSDLQFKEEVIWIIRNKTWGERKRALMDLDGGRIWRRLINEFFPKMRGIRFTILAEETGAEPSVPQTKVDTVYVRDTVYISRTEQNVSPDFSAGFEAPDPSWKESYGSEQVEQKTRKSQERESAKSKRSPRYYDTPWMMAIKTNVLTDAIALWNGGMEFQIGRHLSLDLSGTYTQTNYLYPESHTKIYGFSPELRYWFGQPLSKGSYLGIHGNVAWYTLKGNKTVLYQNVSNDKPAWCVGLDYGYSLKMDRKNHWGVEFNIGLGYGMYSHNTAEQNGLDDTWYSTGTETKHYVGLTRLGVTFSYRFSVRKVRPQGM